VNIQAVTVAAVAAPASVEPANAAPSPDAGQKIEAASAPQTPEAPQPQMPQPVQAPAPEAAKGEIDAAAQAALNTGKPAANAKTESAPQIPQTATGEQKPQTDQADQPVKQAAAEVPTLSMPKLFQNVQPQDGKQPVMQDQNAAPANVAAAVKPEAKPDAGNAAPEHETLESVLSKHFSGDIHVSSNAQVVMPDSARSLQSNPAPMSVSVQTSASAANNQPVPLQAAAVAIEIASRAKDGSRQFDIRLDPPELGRIDVKLDVDKSGQVNTHLTVDRPETLDLLRRDSQGLERALQQAGLKTSDGGLEFSLRQQTPDSPFNQRNQAQPNPQGNAPAITDIEQTATIHAEQYQWAARLRGGVDIRV
jgi:flagellar hook-length control protein FliK